MLQLALKVLKEINSHGFESYIIGGFVRDHILEIESNDIDIATNATPKEIKEIFEDSCLPAEDYGSVTVVKNGILFEITTFRKEINYIDNRRPDKIIYIDSLYEDLLRRDFTINSLCINEEGKIIDLLGGRVDIDNKLIKTIGIPEERFEEDCLRILRAVRFATILNFELDQSVITGINKTKHLLRNLSYYRKKSELDRIFSSSNNMKGVKLLVELGLDLELELDNLQEIKHIDSSISAWSVLNVVDKYPFSSNEVELIKNINEALKLNNLDPMTLYKYGLYVNSVAGDIKGFDKREITEAYAMLTIHSKKDLDIECSDIINVLNKEPGKYLSDIYDDIIYNILYRKLPNEKDAILKYVVNKFKN